MSTQITPREAVAHILNKWLAKMNLSGLDSHFVYPRINSELAKMTEFQADEWLNELAKDLINYGYPRQ